MRVQYILQADGKTRQAEHVLGPLVSFITWQELFERVFHASGDLKSSEQIPSFQTDDNGITYTITERKTHGP